MDATLFILLIVLVAFMYAMVGHGGASGYLALMAIAGIATITMRPSALVLNLCVSAISFTQFARAGHFKWELFWPFALLSVPAAWLGAQVDLDPLVYKRILAVCLLVAVVRLFGLFGEPRSVLRPVTLVWALAIGAVLGLVSGMIGIGGGVLLSPIIILLGWADVKSTAAVSAPFIFVNSLSGLFGIAGKGVVLDAQMWWWVIAAVSGGLLGSWLGAERVPALRLRQALGVVLLFAGIKLFFP
ncbi:MAG: sulfite exporter TauE/SafE family protein [Flavobacteriales bacterium]